MSAICDKGAIRNLLAGVNSLPPEMTFFEIIDNREHSNSKACFIDLNMHNKQTTIGFSEPASKEQIDNMVRWYNVSDKHYDSNRIASRGAGQKLWAFSLTGKHHYISKHSNNKFFTSYMDTNKIYKAELSCEISNKEFSEILSSETNFVREVDEVVQSQNAIFENIENNLPFNPKTIFYVTSIDNDIILNYFKKEENQMNIIKKMKIKYYKEIFENNLELYFKFPNNIHFTQITIDNCVDVIGIANNYIIDSKHITNIYISPNNHKGYIIEIDNKSYKFEKNGNSILRKQIENSSKTPDYTLIQYNTNEISKEEKESSIVGNSLEYYAGLYVCIGGVFISSEKVNWNVTDRNLSGSKNYRAVLHINTDNGKSEIGLSGLKAQFNLSSKENLHNIVKQLTEIYKKYIVLGKPKHPDEYVLVNSSAKKSTIEKKLNGYFYIIEVGKKFYKFGYFENKNRIFSYNDDNNIEKTKKDFPDESIHNNPNMLFFPLHKISNIRGFEEKIKCVINDLESCTTYDTIKSKNNIREYFHCEQFHEKLLPEIKKELANHNK